MEVFTMSKVKWGLSLIFAFILVGILSTAAFAIDPYGLQPVQQSDLSLKVLFTGNSTDPLDVQGRQFDLVLKDTDGSVLKDYGVDAGTTPASLDAADGKGIYNGFFRIPAGDLTPGTIYSVELYHHDDSAHSSLLSKSSALVTDSHNTRMSHVPDVNVVGSGLANSNQTGSNNLNKSRNGQNVHGFYQNNTNSCASCHQTHTGSDANLLFKDGVYSTCSACHDGTTGAYNAFAKVDDKTPNSIAGTFNVLIDGHNGSLHDADASLKISAAPGGNNSATTGPFSQNFDCASCHAPHGAGSNNENNLNIDPLGWGTVQYDSSTNDGKNGKLFKNIKIYTSVPPTESDPYILVKTTTDSNQANVDANYFYKRAGVPAGTPMIQTYRWGYDSETHQDAYVPDYSLWLQEKGFPYKADTALYNDDWSNLVLTDANHNNDQTKDITRNADVHVVWRDGFAWGPGVANVKSAQVSLGIDVETTDNIRSLFDSSYQVLDGNGHVDPTKSYIPDSGTEMSKYCTACHTDYLSNSRTDNTGAYSSAHRHKTVDNLTCVRCHFAHGTEAQIMKDANDNTYYDLTAPGKIFDATVPGNTDKAINYLVDPNASSALKRYTGMSSCYACHGKGEQFMGNPNNIQDATIGETLKAGEPGTDRTN